MQAPEERSSRLFSSEYITSHVKKLELCSKQSGIKEHSAHRNSPPFPQFSSPSRLLFFHSVNPSSKSCSMSIPSSNWQTRAAEKRKSLLASIRDDWKLSPEDLAKAKSQRDITGVVPEHLKAAEVSILAKDAPDIVNHLKDGTYSALQVTTAFCKAPAIAYQIVSLPHTSSFAPER